MAEGDQLNVKSPGPAELQRGSRRCDRKTADWLVEGLTRKKVPRGGRDGKSPLFSKVTGAARQRENTFGRICVDIARGGRNTRGGRAPVASPGYSLVFQGQGPPEEQRPFRKPRILSVSRGDGGPDRRYGARAPSD